jgi:probable rRNA maturation factor
MNEANQLSLSVQYASNAKKLPTRSQFRRWVKVALEQDVQMVLRIVNEVEGRALNLSYRGKDYATNVLTFVYDDAQPRRGGVEPSDETTSHSTRPSKNAGQVAGYGAGGAAERLLPQAAAFDSNVSQSLPLYGDVVICAPIVAREAKEQGKDLLAHYAHLTIHAALHLQGYDHEKKRDAEKMEARETALMLKLRYPAPYLIS